MEHLSSKVVHGVCLENDLVCNCEVKKDHKRMERC